MSEAIQAPQDRDLLDSLLRHAVRYFLTERNPATGLIADSTEPGAPCSIAGTGMGLGMYPVAVERGDLPREEAVRHAVTVLRFFDRSPQSAGADATGHRGFYYHFLDMSTGRRTWKCELSTIDTALLIVGALTAAAYFVEENAGEQEVRELADRLYRRVDWRWALDGGGTLTHGWRPESGFLPYRWRGYDEALILYLLALGSPTYPIHAESYRAWTSTYIWRRAYDWELLHAGPLFIHQYSHLWVDFREIRDRFMREHDSDYFENSRRAALVQREYARRNTKGFKGYSDCCWGLTACHGPGPATFTVDGHERRFLGYSARGAPDGPDDGTIAPWATVAALPFCPVEVLPALLHFQQLHGDWGGRYGFHTTFNPTYPARTDARTGWFCPWNYAIDQGAMGLMIDNFRAGTVWRLLRECPPIAAGLRKADFTEA